MCARGFAKDIAKILNLILDLGFCSRTHIERPVVADFFWWKERGRAVYNFLLSKKIEFFTPKFSLSSSLCNYQHNTVLVCVCVQCISAINLNILNSKNTKKKCWKKINIRWITIFGLTHHTRAATLFARIILDNFFFTSTKVWIRIFWNGWRKRRNIFGFGYVNRFKLNSRCR